MYPILSEEGADHFPAAGRLQYRPWNLQKAEANLLRHGLCPKEFGTARYYLPWTSLVLREHWRANLWTIQSECCLRCQVFDWRPSLGPTRPGSMPIMGDGKGGGKGAWKTTSASGCTASPEVGLSGRTHALLASIASVVGRVLGPMLGDRHQVNRACFGISFPLFVVQMWSNWEAIRLYFGPTGHPGGLFGSSLSFPNHQDICDQRPGAPWEGF